MKQIKRRLFNILSNEMMIDKSLINENALLQKHLSISTSEFNLLLYYCERDMKIDIPDEQIDINQNLHEFVTSIYRIKRSDNGLKRAS